MVHIIKASGIKGSERVEENVDSIMVDTLRACLVKMKLSD